MVGIVLAVLLAFASLSATAGYLWARADSDRPAPQRALPAQWPSKDGEALRPVPMPGGELVTALPTDTGGQVLCQALDQERWESLLGGKVLREVRDGACHVVGTTAEVLLTLDSRAANLQDPSDVEVAGHPGQLEYLPPEVNARLDVRLVDAEGTGQVHPYLRVELSGNAGVDTLTESVAREVVQAVSAPGPALPAQAKDGTIPLQHPAPAAIVDAPWPMISWQLCAALTRELGGTGKPRFDGSCTVRGVEATYTDIVTPRAFPERIAGRPALVTDELVAVKLTDDGSQELTFTGPGRSLRSVAEAVLPRLLDR
ncbi:hypothetical protein GCM10017566_15630 [Amycolatopsis bartoniae]|uniref:Uncharacterized protein n=1 Tax=Amycolatopsis bartoniae TaxID=941986 RepID=A0A8H9IRM6_9PSEU|nr:hypothetical protein GCM10017566_15630 [Amycolatopsis bartoniae]